MLVLPVVVQQLGEDGEVEEGEDEADCLEGDLLDLLTVGRRTQLSPVYVDHLGRDLNQSKHKLRLLSLYLHSNQLLRPGVWTAVEAVNICQFGEKILNTN